MEGLEVSEKFLLKTIENKDFRIDSQFYTKEPIKNPKLKYDKIGNLLDTAQYGISISMNENNEGYPIYRMNEIHNMLCDTEVLKCADISSTELATFKLNDRDVVFNRTNSFEWVGRTGLYRKLDDRDFVFASYLVRFIPDEKVLLPEYLSAFLNSKYGVWDIKRRARQSINQTNVNPEEVKQIEIPMLSMTFQNKIKSFFDNAHNDRLNAQNSYAQAEQILLQEIGLQYFTPNTEAVNIKSFKNSFGTSGRLDAEYYQMKYEKIEEKIKLYSNGYSVLSTEIEYLRTGEYSKSYVAKTDKNHYYIRNSNISKGVITPDNAFAVAPTHFKSKSYLGEILTSRVGTIGLFGVITKSLENSIYSDNVLCFKLLNKHNPYVYSVLFSTKPYQFLLEKLAGGSVQPLITQTTLKSLLVPILTESVQQKGESLIKESFTLKQQSEHLLAVAKRAVEIAIEENEGAALAYISAEVS